MAFGIELVSDIEDALHRLRHLRATNLNDEQQVLVDEIVAGLTNAVTQWETRMRGRESQPLGRRWNDKP